MHSIHVLPARAQLAQEKRRGKFSERLDTRVEEKRDTGLVLTIDSMREVSNRSTLSREARQDTPAEDIDLSTYIDEKQSRAKPVKIPKIPKTAVE